MTVGLDEDCEGRLAASSLEQIIPLASHATVVALGPGLGRSAELDHLIRRLYAMLARPMVVDADGLNALAGDPRILASHDGPRILTPHPGEFVRLLGVGKSTREACIERSVQLAGESAIVVVLKGHRTLVTDGTDRWQATTGNPGMATGGSGDVLTGVITGLVGQGLSPVGAARLGVHIHGLAGDLAARRLGQVAMIASDLLRFLPRAFLTLADSGQ
jgi:NAD(P)H-hydrate epimerase